MVEDFDDEKRLLRAEVRANRRSKKQQTTEKNVTIRMVLATLSMVLVMLRMELVDGRQLRQVHSL